MRSIVQDAYGPADVLVARDIDRPVPRDDEVLLRVHAAGVGPDVWHLMMGLPYMVRLAFGLRRPRNPVRGSDGAGRVEAVGAGVTRFKPGDDLVRTLGATRVIDYTREEITDRAQRYDVILDTAGDRPLSLLRRALARRGTLVIVGGEGGGRWLGVGRPLRAQMLSPFVRQRLGMFVAVTRGEDLQTLGELAEKGALTPVVDRTYALPEAPEAVRHLRDGHPRGKIVLTI